MLKPALLYKDELKRKYVEQWYKPETRYYTGMCNGEIELVDHNEHKRQYVSIDKNGNVIGYIVHNIDWCTRSAQQWGMISFDKGNLEFVRDLYRTVSSLFLTENFNRVEWWCFTDNPAVRGYERFIRRFGGRIAGMLHNAVAFSDGSLHDEYIFEILKEDVKVTKSLF